jgi:cysteine desulfurase
MLTSKVYFDHAATTPLHPEVKEAMIHAMEVFGNPTSIHGEGRKSRVFVEECRARVANLLGVRQPEVFFTSGGTESVQTALTGAVRDLGIRRIVTTPLEHPAVLRNLEYLGLHYPLEIVNVPFDERGRITPEVLEPLLQSDQKSLVVLMHANNETGMLLPLKRIAALCNAYHALLLSDTVQTIGKYRIDLMYELHFAAASAHKFHGPKGSGLLIMPQGGGIGPLIRGGGQERTLRSGTENIIGIAGMVKALEVALRDLDETMHHISTVRNHFIKGALNISSRLLLLTDVEHSLYSILNIGFPTAEFGEMLVYRLDMEGIAVSGGSACASGVNHPSHVLDALGLGRGNEHVRFSFSRFSTFAEADLCLEAIKQLKQ